MGTHGTHAQPSPPWRRTLSLWLLALLCVVLQMQPGGAWAQVVAEVTNATGTVHVRKPNGSLRLASVGSGLEAGEILSAEDHSSVRIRFTDGTELVLKPGTRMRIDGYRFDAQQPAEDELSFSLLKGGLRAVSGAIGTRGNKDAFRARSAVGNIGIRGTQFGMLFCAPGECDALLDGLPPGLRERLGTAGLFFEVTVGAIAFINDTGEYVLTAPEWGYAERVDLPPLIVREGSLDGASGAGGAQGGPPGGGVTGQGGGAMPPFPLREVLPLVAPKESVGGFSAGLGFDLYAQCLLW